MHLAILGKSNYDAQFAHMLIDAGANVNRADDKGKSALHVACNFNNTSVAYVLIKAGAKIDALNSTGEAPNLSITDLSGRSFLHLAFKEGDLLVASRLYAAGAKFDARDIHGNTPTDYFSEYIMRMPAEGRGEILALAIKLFPKIEWPLGLEWSLDAAHYTAGAQLQENLPSELPPNMVLLGSELEWQEKHENKEVLEGEKELRVVPLTAAERTFVSQMLTKIENKTAFLGLGEKSEAEVAEWYSRFVRYLSHVIEAYQIGDATASAGTRTVVMQRLADMQLNCAPRWMTEIQQLYVFRPQEGESQASEPSLLNLGDKLLQRLRNERLNIVTTKILQFGLGNVHESNYLLNLLGDDLQKLIDRLQSDIPEEAKWELLIQKAEADLQTQLTLLPANIEKLVDQIEGDQEELDTMQNDLADNPQDEELQNDVKNREIDLEELKTNKENLENQQKALEVFISKVNGKSPEQKKAILQEAKQPFFDGEPLKEALSTANLKGAQINEYFRQIAFDEDGLFTRQAAVDLLESIHAIRKE